MYIKKQDLLKTIDGQIDEMVAHRANENYGLSYRTNCEIRLGALRIFRVAIENAEEFDAVAPLSESTLRDNVTEAIDAEMHRAADEYMAAEAGSIQENHAQRVMYRVQRIQNKIKEALGDPQPKPPQGGSK